MRAIFLGKKATKRIQYIMMTMLYCARSVDPAMLRARDTEEKARILLDYAATYLNAILCYKPSDMVIHVDSDAACLTMLESRSCYAGHFYMSNWPSPTPIKPNPNRNGLIHT